MAVVVKRPNLSWLTLKVVMMASALVAVLGLISALRKSGSQRTLESFFAGDALWNWCPAQPVELRMAGASEPTLKSSRALRDLCEVTLEPVDAPAVKAAHFVPLLQITSSDGALVKLETDAEKHLFRVKGLPFRSKNLESALEKYTKR